MFQNIKTDIIYYKTNTDFEMEFNLCGCCRMRLLNDKCSDKKALVHSLARAVSRSKVIIIAAPLYSNEKAIEIVAEAIGTSTITINNSDFGILSDEKINIIKNSTPLVAPDGTFGGCIIESGPQSLILLTDDNKLRKTILKNLIHPYIQELYSSSANDSNTNKDELLIEDTPEDIIIEDLQDEALIDDIDDEETSINEDEQFILEETDYENQDDSNPFIETDSELAENIILESAPEDYTSTESDDDGDNEGILFNIVEEDYDEQNYKEDADDDVNSLIFDQPDTQRRSFSFNTKSNYNNEDDDYTPNSNIPNNSKLNVALLVISIILLLTLAVLCFCIFYIPTKQGITPTAYLQDIFNTLFGT